MPKSTLTVRTAVAARGLRVGDVIVAQVNRGEIRSTVTTEVRRLPGSELVAFGLERDGVAPWDGLLNADTWLTVERVL